jgi:hypothetical protein
MITYLLKRLTYLLKRLVMSCCTDDHPLHSRCTDDHPLHAETLSGQVGVQKGTETTTSKRSPKHNAIEAVTTLAVRSAYQTEAATHASRHAPQTPDSNMYQTWRMLLCNPSPAPHPPAKPLHLQSLPVLLLRQTQHACMQVQDFVTKVEPLPCVCKAQANKYLGTTARL